MTRRDTDLPPMEVADTIAVPLDEEGARACALYPAYCRMATSACPNTEEGSVAVCETAIFPAVPDQPVEGVDQIERLASAMRTDAINAVSSIGEAEFLNRVAAVLEGVAVAVRIQKQKGLL